MMNFKQFEMDSNVKGQIFSIKNKISKVMQEQVITYTDFLNPSEQLYVKNLCNIEKLNCSFYGGPGSFERALAAIYFGDDECFEYPLTVISVSGKTKFEDVGYNDFLGTIMGLGLKREKIGDINIFDNCVELWVMDDISNYIISNFFKVKHTEVSCETIRSVEAHERNQKYKIINTNIASLRIDNIVASILHSSRSESTSLIKGGDVKLNYIVCNDISSKVCKDDVISIRHSGRYVIFDLNGTTRSGNIKVTIKKYV